MRPSRGLATLAALSLLTLSTLTACGGDAEDPAGGSDGGTSQDASGGSDPVAEETTDGGGDGGGEGTGMNFADCSALTAEEVAPILGEGTGASEVPPGGGSCTYSLDDPTQPSVSIEQIPLSDFADGFEGAKANISNTAIGPVENATETDVDGVGDGAKVTVGDSVGGTSLQSIGLVLVGDTIVRASVLQAVDLDQAAMLELTTNLLTLIASKA